MDEQELEKRIKELEVLKVHPKDIDENRLLMQRLLALHEEVTLETRELMSDLIRRYEYTLEQQNPRKIKKIRENIERIIPQIESYNPFVDTFEWSNWADEDFDEDEEQKEESEDNSFNVFGDGDNKWTS